VGILLQIKTLLSKLILYLNDTIVYIYCYISLVTLISLYLLQTISDRIHLLYKIEFHSLTLYRHCQVVDFTNVIQAKAQIPKVQKDIDDLSVFLHFLDLCVLKLHVKMLKATLDVNYINNVCATFLYKSESPSFLWLHSSFVIFWAKILYKKCVHKMLMKLMVGIVGQKRTLQSKSDQNLGARGTNICKNIYSYFFSRICVPYALCILMKPRLRKKFMVLPFICKHAFHVY